MSRKAAFAVVLILLAGAYALVVILGTALARSQAGAPRAGDPAFYVSGGKTIHVEVFRPAGEGRLPAVLLLHGADCLQVPWITAGYRQSARRLADRGYVVLMVHYMDRTGTRRTGPVDMARNFTTWMDTIRDGIGFAQSRKDVVPDRIGLVGISLGASLSICVGGVDERPKAVVEYFGGLPEAAVPQVKRTPPILILHGDADRLVNVKEAYKLERVLKERGLPYEMRVYPGQGHGFTGAAAADSDERTVAFLDKYLKPAKKSSRRTPETSATSETSAAPSPSSGPLARSKPERRNPMLHQQGMRIVDGRGREVKLRGVSLGGWLVWEGWIFGKGILTPQATITSRLEKAVGARETDQFREQVYGNFITEADIEKIARAGFNCVRVPLHYRMLDQESGWRMLDRLLGWCKNRHLYAVLDLHMTPGSSLGMQEPAPVWKSEESRLKVIGIWRQIAARYHNREVIAGYDLINEPLPPSGEALASLYRRIIATIREVDRDHLVILEGSQFATDFSMFNKPLDSNQAYSFHMYTWFGDDRQAKLDGYLALARRQNAPLWAGEYGENSYDMIRSTVDLYEQHPEINGWAFWTWKKAPTSYPGLVTIRVPKDWAATMDWVSSWLGLNQPKADTVRAGMREFLQAMKFGNCDYDTRMERILLKHRKQQPGQVRRF